MEYFVDDSRRRVVEDGLTIEDAFDEAARRQAIDSLNGEGTTLYPVPNFKECPSVRLDEEE
jgi:hypothetical protein